MTHKRIYWLQYLKTYREVARSIASRDGAAAICRLAPILAADPHDRYALEVLAYCQRSMGESIRAIETAHRLLALDEHHFGALRLLSELHASLNEPDLAAKYARQALEHYSKPIQPFPEPMILVLRVARRVWPKAGILRELDFGLLDDAGSGDAPWFKWARHYVATHQQTARRSGPAPWMQGNAIRDLIPTHSIPLLAKLTVLMNRSLLASAAIYLALLPSNALTFIRSFSFAIAAIVAVSALIGSWIGHNERTPSPGRAVIATFAIWGMWSIASLAWTTNPEYSASELRREIESTSLTLLIFYMAARNTQAWRVLVATALTAFACYSALALIMMATPMGWNPARWHSGVGPYATHVVLIAPLLLTLLAPLPVGLGAGPRAVAVGLVLLTLMFATARLTENRMVWAALGAVFGTASIVASLRWRPAFGLLALRWLLPLTTMLVVVAALFVSTASERAQSDFSSETSVIRTLYEDPRLSLWEHTLSRLHERPWTGFGFGRAILAEQFKGEMQNPMLSHPHNLFVSQLLQTGAIGFCLFVALLVSLCRRFTGFIRTSDDALAFVGVLGVSLIAGFVVKNLTDDFLFRSNAKEFWALLSLLLGLGVRIEASVAASSDGVRQQHAHNSLPNG